MRHWSALSGAQPVGGTPRPGAERALRAGGQGQTDHREPELHGVVVRPTPDGDDFAWCCALHGWCSDWVIDVRLAGACPICEALVYAERGRARYARLRDERVHA